MNTERNLYLIGSGGIGKTTTLLSVMAAAYGENSQGRVERNRLKGQVPLFVELSGAPDVVPASPSGREWQVYREGRSTFIHRAIYRQIRRDLRLRQINETSLDQIDEVYKADYDVAVKPIVSLFNGETPAPEYILLLDGLNEISRREITHPGAEGDPCLSDRLHPPDSGCEAQGEGGAHEPPHRKALWLRGHHGFKELQA